ncbi:MAG TPA: hypothetical protein VG734_14095 [Lacunisphaera sp.]|nr:hypothetical protein [Lacunisphaera sp.]
MLPGSNRTRLILLTMLIALGWAAFTQHVWEDYYITYRASKNLATGQGLTFTAGERVHSFTSPLGVLLPAAASLMTGNRYDAGALLIFRLMSAAALAGAVYLAMAAVRLAGGAVASGLVCALMLTDAKTIDFTINGMETAFLLLFMAWTAWALFTSPPRRWLHLGLAWAGMMWTRPDAFVYIGGLAGATWLFQPVERPWWKRLLAFGVYLRAGLVTTGLYLPWLLWAWHYYGTPVPHTITAKGLHVPPITPGLLGDWLVAFPGRMWKDPSILAGTFMPAYSYYNDTALGWPRILNQLSAVLAAIAIGLWLVPKVRWEVRVASLAALVGQFYQHSFVNFPIPWYLPAVTFLSFLALGLALGQLAAAGGWPGWRWVARLAGGTMVAVAAGLALAAAWQLRCQQRIIEEGQRRVIGEWLKAHAASPRDTVFLEPLGYIGFYSGLKMYDYPGLSSPEVVAARRRAGTQGYPLSWAELIMDLQPDWLVLRPNERNTIQARDPGVLSRYYELAVVADARERVKEVKFLPGRGYLVGDAYFEVFHRRAGLPAGIGLKPIKQAQLTRRDAWGQPAYDFGASYLLAHAPSQVEFPVAPGARWISGGFGFLAEAYTEPPKATQGAVFIVTHVSERGVRTVLLERLLQPTTEAKDRGTHPFRFELPPGAGGHLELVTRPGPSGSNAYGWTYWAELMLETPHHP